MKRYNVLMVLSPDGERLLMCLRRKPPYQGLYNLPGGKIEPAEGGEDAAYRELMEETGIGRDAIRLCHVMDFTYYLEDGMMEVWAGRVKCDVAVHGEENALCWVDAGEDFFDDARFAGMGNIGHMLRQARRFEEIVFG